VGERATPTLRNEAFFASRSGNSDFGLTTVPKKGPPVGVDGGGSLFWAVGPMRPDVVWKLLVQRA
jgi:hypothetical protein